MTKRKCTLEGNEREYQVSLYACGMCECCVCEFVHVHAHLHKCGSSDGLVVYARSKLFFCCSLSFLKMIVL